MTATVRNPLTKNTLIWVWAFLVVITIASWWLGRGADAPFQLDGFITAGVLLIAAIKARLVIRYFMEVRYAPAWLKWTCDGWLVSVFLMLFGFYWATI